MRLRTLPVSVAGVIAAAAFAVMTGVFDWLPAVLCLLFAVLAQIASNFANEYYDFKGGLDRPGREGPRRGVTEGDISASAMLRATIGVLACACAIGLCTVYWGGWWLVLAGAVIAIGVLAYSAGPYPLSHHGWGETAVVFFFGIIPVTLTYYVMAQQIDWAVALGGVAMGLMGANVLIVNNYRDKDDDEAVGKRTMAVIFGRKAMAGVYLANGWGAVILMSGTWYMLISRCWPYALIPIAYLAIHTKIYANIRKAKGRELNKYLGITAMVMLAYAVMLLVAAAVRP